MKKNRLIAICAIVLALVLVFAGCGSKAPAGAKREDSISPMAPGYYASDSGSYYDDYDYPETPSATAVPQGEWAGKDPLLIGELTEGMMNSNNTEFDKIIYTADVSMETLEFEQTIENLYALIKANGAFIESSSVSGTGYNSGYYGTTYRTAWFCIRVPKDKFSGLTGSLASIGNVTNSDTSAENITSSFIDTESRLKAYRTEESSLLAMMEKAETVEEMITIQDRLSTVRYEIERLTSMLNNWQNYVDYSTVNINIREVKKYTEEPVVPKTFGQEITDGFNSSVKWLKQALRDIAVFVVSALPVLVLPILILLPAAIILLIVLLSVRSHKKKKAKKQAPEAK
ncbi:MAG: DUF4349 domain-containing protein [Oscillospiraceae bacterium]|nr:DUF4349 domain-containing protein [Oscillospiraceae bacterium]